VLFDHVFAFIDPKGPALDTALATGLTVSYRREHHGQGTANACFVFDNGFVELLWLTSETEVRSPPIARTKLWERSQWAAQDTCPYGLAWLGDCAEIKTWPFEPPYLPKGIAIPVACDSDHPFLPMMFTFPIAKVSSAQSATTPVYPAHPGGWSRIVGLDMTLAEWAPFSAALQMLADRLSPPLNIQKGNKFSLEVTLGRDDGNETTLTI
jgi:hypothetical protein